MSMIETCLGLFRRFLPAATILAIGSLWLIAASDAFAESIKVGVVKLGTSGPVFIAQEKGYFAAEGLTAEVILFDAAQPVAVAVASGDVDFGVAPITAGLFSLGGQGAVRIIGGLHRYVPGFHGVGYLASNRAYAAGLTSVDMLGGHSVAVTQIGSGYHYSLALVADNYHIDLKTIRILPLQSNPNIASALTGGQADAGLLATTPATPLIAHGDAKLLGWVDDETPWQNGAVFANTKVTNEHQDTVRKFLNAFRKGAQLYHEAYTGPDDRPRIGPEATEVATIVIKYTGETLEQAKQGGAYIDSSGRLDVKDVLHQIDWYKAQGMLKADVNGDEIIDKRYVVPLPGP